VFSLYSTLGLEENASQSAVQESHARLIARLKLDDFEYGTRAYDQAKRCISAIERAYKTLSDAQLKLKYQEQRAHAANPQYKGDVRPRIGQLCVASGMISMEQLQEAVEMQDSIGLPIGEVLQQKHFISQAELDGLLLGQEIIDVPAECTDPIGKRLVSLGLASEDMILVATMEQRTTGHSLQEIVVSHGWVDQKIVDVIL
jgi:hypothetical protein